MRYGIFTILLIFFAFSSNAQQVRKPFIIGTQIHTGINLPFYKALNYLVQDEIYAVDFTLTLPSSGKDYWETIYNYPQTGIGYSFWSPGNKEVLGRAHVLYTFINFPLYKRNDKFSFDLQLSSGGAYLTRTFDVYDNHLNRAIGSRLNIYFRLGFDCNIRLLPGCNLKVEAGTTHFSNGKTRSPNYGINEGSLSMGINYEFNRVNTPLQQSVIPVFTRRYLNSITWTAGYKAYDDLGGSSYLTTSVSYNIERLINHKSKLGFGTDLFYDGSIRQALASENGVPEHDLKMMMRVGLHASYTLTYRHLLLGVQAGHYVYSRYKVLSNIYNRLSAGYLINDQLAGVIAVKSHWGKADCFEYGILYFW